MFANGFVTMKSKLDHLREILADEMYLPDIKGRHLFAARLRIILFLIAWALFFLFYPSVWVISPFVPLTFNLGFLITAICNYYFIRYNRVNLYFIILEIVADVISQTAIVYVLGYDSFAPFFVYGFYITGVGIFTGYFSALLAAIVVMVCYFFMSILIQTGGLEPFIYVSGRLGVFQINKFQSYLNYIFLPVALIFIVYSVRIANYFSKLKELVLQRRNNQLVALSHIGATIRHSLDIKKVRNEVLKSVIQGLGFDVCILALVQKEKHRISFHLPEGNDLALRLEQELRIDFSKVFLSLQVENNSVFIAIKRNKVLVRNNFAEIMLGLSPDVEMQTALKAQRTLDFKKFVITPLVAEKRVVGAIIGASKKAYIEQSVVDSLDHFSNQAAMALESAQLIQELEEKNKQLLEADQLKSYFLTIMSHELRTPLNAVIGYTEILMDNVLGQLNEDQKHSLSEVLRNGRNLLELINSVLDLAKLESGKMELCIEDFNLRDFVFDVKSTVMPLTAKKQQEFNIHIQDSLPLIKADPVKVRQILVNLIGNSIKFTKARGEIDVFLEYYEDAKELYEQDFSNEDVTQDMKDAPAFLIRVRDNGIGIKPEDRESIFELFKQADPSYTRNYEGSGLGLALTKQLVLLHEGRIVVKSEYEKGTEFKVVLPQFEKIKQ